MGFTPILRLKNGYTSWYFHHIHKPKAVPPNPNFNSTTHPTPQPFFIFPSSSHAFPGCSSNLQHPLPMPSVCGTSSAKANLLNYDSESGWIRFCNKSQLLQTWAFGTLIFCAIITQFLRNSNAIERISHVIWTQSNVIPKILVPTRFFTSKYGLLRMKNSVPQTAQKMRSADL